MFTFRPFHRIPLRHVAAELMLERSLRFSAKGVHVGPEHTDMATELNNRAWLLGRCPSAASSSMIALTTPVVLPNRVLCIGKT